MKLHSYLFAAVLFSGCLNVGAAGMVKIEGGSYRPLYLKKDTPLIPVKSFQLDKTPITNAEFSRFVQKHPQWQRGKVGVRHAEAQYLSHWVKQGNAYVPKATDANKPVVNVSWFAAHAYCVAQGKRLPTIDEWEYVGQASALQKNGTNEASYNRTILDWYADGGRSGLRDVGKGKANFYGVHDMHGMIWEWTEDFNSSLLNGGSNSDLYCGGGSNNATDPSNYVAFMRFGIRTSLKAPFVLKNLGFRCAK
ncbi:formylglycine-generating enzyme family protein [Wielerella bovis]|uniref:formylglycine-generating enzyme family protein n=1 Tax=Wielerella bovis TaxID=2917790 RepID=UPI002019C7EF|nr:formylglycine-generating enzyme family protein [Wielerella bovis]ULJ62235.1 formylglycine-generating enzyme family protein [Wielerella bovis]